MQGLVPTRAHAPVHGQRPDQDQPFQALGMLKLRIFELKASALEVGKGRFNGPPRAIIEHRRARRRAVHGDNPRFRVPGLMQDAQIRQKALRKQLHPRQVTFFNPLGQLARGDFVPIARIGQ